MIKQKRHKLQPNLRYAHYPIGTRVRVKMDIMWTDYTGRPAVRFAAGTVGEIVSPLMFGKYEVRFSDDMAPVRVHDSRLEAVR